MRKIYLVKKDPAKDGQDNWITMNGYEFAMFMKTLEGQARKDGFGQIDACGSDDNIIVMECGAEIARKWRAEKDRHDYLVEKEIASGITTFSYSSIYSEDEDVTGEDMLRDENCNVEEIAVLNLQIEELQSAINMLQEQERNVIQHCSCLQHHLPKTNMQKLLV